MFEKILAPLRPLKNISPALFNKLKKKKFFTAQNLHKKKRFFSPRGSAGGATLITGTGAIKRVRGGMIACTCMVPTLAKPRSGTMVCTPLRTMALKNPSATTSMFFSIVGCQGADFHDHGFGGADHGSGPWFCDGGDHSLGVPPWGLFLAQNFRAFYLFHLFSPFLRAWRSLCRKPCRGWLNFVPCNNLSYRCSVGRCQLPSKLVVRHDPIIP